MEGVNDLDRSLVQTYTKWLSSLNDFSCVVTHSWPNQ